MIQNILLGFIYMDGLMTDRWLPQLLMSEEELFEDQPLSLFFDSNGYQSMNVMKNLGSTSIYFIVIFLIFLVLVLILIPLSMIEM